nr:unnamed protein product [Callosobruchus analis]
MEEYIQDMSDEESIAVDSDDDPEYVQEEDIDIPASNGWGHIERNFKDFVFDEPFGVPADTINELRGRNELECFSKIVTEEVIYLMVKQTNIYADQNLVEKIVDESIGPKSRLNDWVTTNSAEMKVILAMIIWMGLDRKPTLKYYWSRSALYANQISKLIPRNRFEILLRMWHFSNIEECPPAERLHKIQPVIDIINENIKVCMVPGENICIDESMVPFRGQISFRQYVKGKRHRFGFKVFKLCLKGGYTYHMKVYCGFEKTNGRPVANKIVIELMGNLLDAGRTLFSDSWYTSVGLAKHL